MKSAQAQILYNRALAYAATDTVPAAMEDYNRALNLDPHFGPASLNRGILHFTSKNYDQAIADLSKAIQLDPSKPLSYTERAKAYRKLGKTALADADDAKVAELK